MTDDFDARRRSFDSVAERYEAERPGYPQALFDELVGRVGPGARVLEIGCGTGKATRELARRGLHVTGVEPGRSLAAVARRVLSDLPVTLHESRFEDWDAPRAAFELAVSAQAYHWVDAEAAAPRIAAALVPDGVLTCFWNTVVGPVDWLTRVYVDNAPELEFDAVFPPLDERIDEQRRRVELGGVFDVVEVRRYPWTMRKTADEYVRLIDTFSEHRTLSETTRARLYPAVHAAIERLGGVFERDYIAYVLVARPAGR